ncbi:MAG TPA: hypothetical protein VFL42_11215, partial [Terriglobales bacterium]|nr:hypothetical protein [Terriglobales bacterium]
MIVLVREAGRSMNPGCSTHNEEERMRPVQFLLAALMLTGMCLSQDQGSSQGGQGTTPPSDQKGQVSATQGQKTVVGCIAMGAPSGYVLKGEDGKTYPLRTDR